MANRKLNFNRPFIRLDGTDEPVLMKDELAAMLRTPYQMEAPPKLMEKIAREELSRKVYGSSETEYTTSEIERIRHVLDLTAFISSAAQIALYMAEAQEKEDNRDLAP